MWLGKAKPRTEGFVREWLHSLPSRGDHRAWAEQKPRRRREGRASVSVRVRALMSPAHRVRLISGTNEPFCFSLYLIPLAILLFFSLFLFPKTSLISPLPLSLRFPFSFFISLLLYYLPLFFSFCLTWSNGFPKSSCLFTLPPTFISMYLFTYMLIKTRRYKKITFSICKEKNNLSHIKIYSMCLDFWAGTLYTKEGSAE